MLSAKIDLSITRKCEVGGGSLFAVLGLWVAFVRPTNVLTLVRWVILVKILTNGCFKLIKTQYLMTKKKLLLTKLQILVTKV